MSDWIEEKREPCLAEEGYRKRFSYDKVVRSTHGVNCTGSCSWQIFVKDGIITYEIQQNDYPSTQEGLPEYEPRGCPCGASYSWYEYSPHRIKYPMIRRSLYELYKEKRKNLDPVSAWGEVVKGSSLYKQKRGNGSFIRISFDEALEIIAAANVYTIKNYGPDRVVGFSPIPAKSMVSYASGSRYLSLIGGAVLSFYDWYCDLPPSSPQMFGDQTDVPESADWYNSTYLVLWGSNVPQTRRPDAHFFTETRYKGTKTVVISPDFNEACKFADIWLNPKPGTDAALGMAMGHVVLKEFFIDKRSDYFESYCKKFSDMPCLVILEREKEFFKPGRLFRSSDMGNKEKFDEWKTVVFDKEIGICVPNGSIGFRYQDNGKWNLESKDSKTGKEINPELSLIDFRDIEAKVLFPYFGETKEVITRKVPAKRITVNSKEFYVSTVFDLLVAHYGVDRGLDDENVAKDYNDPNCYTPAWQEKITGVKKEIVIKIAREFANNALLTSGKSMIIIGAGVNHYYYTDTIYRAAINLLTMCGCIGQSGGGWAHYVGQEKVRPLAGWSTFAFALDWYRPPRHVNSTSFFYVHTGQYRYETLKVEDLLSPIAKKDLYSSHPFDLNVKAIRLGWLPSAPYLNINPLDIFDLAKAKSMSISDYILDEIKKKNIMFSYQDPENEKNYPRNMFVWRSNIMGASSKGHEYFIKYLLGAKSGLIEDEADLSILKEVKVKEPVIGKLDLLVTMDFRMSTTCLYSDIILPSATWYEKEDISTTDMHPFIHPFSQAVDPLWESKTDWEIFKAIAKKFSELAKDNLGKRIDTVLSPLLHDTPSELGQPTDVKDWKLGECDILPGKTFPNISQIERDYSDVYRQYISIGPLVEKLGIGAKGVSWLCGEELNDLKSINSESNDLVSIFSARNVCDAIMHLSPETNSSISFKAWENISKKTGRDHSNVLPPKEYVLKFSDLQVQPRRTITSPCWSGIESKEIPYSANYLNVHELIPWRTLSGRIEIYQDHRWMRDFGENFAIYKAPVDILSNNQIKPDENSIKLKFCTAHQKFGIHTTFIDLQIMQNLSRGGPHVWLSESDAKSIGVCDNDWVELSNRNGTVIARAVLSQRIPNGMVIMYHAQDKVLNNPFSQKTSVRGGVHNSLIKILLNPLHMIGGYAQLSYFFNYYGTIGSNRDDFVIVRKLSKVIWTQKEKGGEDL